MQSSPRNLSLSLVVLMLAVFGACAPATAGGGGSGNADLITLEDLQEASSANNAYDAVRIIRPQWLRARGVASFSGQADPIMVYVDNVRFGEAESLRSLSVDVVQEIEWIDATTATQRWGTGHAGGALSVTTQRGG